MYEDLEDFKKSKYEFVEFVDKHFLEEYGWYQDYIVFVIKNVVIDYGSKYNFGDIQIKLSRMSENDLIYNIHTNCQSEHGHPHIGVSLSICLGEGHYDILRCVKNGYIMPAVQMIESVLSTYGSHDPHYRIEKFAHLIPGSNMRVCSLCSQISDKNAKIRGKSYCADCFKYCTDDNLGKFYLPSLLEKCYSCEEIKRHGRIIRNRFLCKGCDD